jgi:dienelactone hydrolase
MTEISYTAGDTECIGYLAQPKGDGPHPVVMVAPAYRGLDDFVKERADWLATLGYIGFAVDYYGNGRLASDMDEASAMMQALNNDRPSLRARMLAALETARTLPNADPSRIAAMGFCMGGKAVLDLARSGATLSGVIGFHGVFDAPPEGCETMNTSVLLLHGWDDPLATPQQAVDLAAELTAHCNDWQMLAFGNTAHSFTNPAAQAPEAGNVYSKRANDRAFAAMLAFLKERFAQS